MQTSVIYESEHLRVMFRPGTSRYALITFNPATMLAEGDRYWCQPIAEKADLTAVGIMTHRSNWYPADDMRKLAAILGPLLVGYEQVIAYGSSMGAYGALKYGRLLGATHCLSFAPQWSIAPGDVGEWDTRFLENFRPELHHGMRIGPGDSVPAPVVFYDPFFELDRLSLDRITEACGSAHAVRAYLTGHFPVNMFAGTAKVLELFEMCLTGDIEAIRRRSTEARRDPALRLRVQVLAESFIKTNMKAAFRLLERYPGAYGPRERAAFYHQMAGTHMARRDYDDAARCSDAALADLPTVRDFYIRRSTIEENRGDLAAALAFAEQGVAKWPAEAPTHVRLSEVEALRGNRAAADAARMQALQLDPTSASVIHAMIRDAAARSDDAAQLLWMRRLVEASPTAESYRRLAELLTRLGRHREAADELVRATAVSPGSARLWMLLADSHMAGSKFIKAAEAAAEAVRLNPSDLRANRIVVAGYERMGMGEYAAPYRQKVAALEAARPPVAEAAPQAPAPRRSWLSGLPFLGRRRRALAAG